MAAGRPGYRKTTLFVHQLWCQHDVSVYSDKESHRDIFINLVEISKLFSQILNELFTYDACMQYDP